jgi:DNA topoisomerase-1
VGVGRFGPYVRHEKTFVSVPKGVDPLEISLEEAVELLEKKRQTEAQNFIKGYDDEPDLRVLNGRYGPYISYKKKNYKLPEGVEAAHLTKEACLKLIEAQNDRGPVRRKPAARAAKPKK